MKNKPNFPKKPFWILFGIGILLIIFSLISFRGWHNDADYQPRACGGDRCFMVELARTPAEQEKGLMFRESMDTNSGMLFIFETSDIHNFRMKNTLIPLDMIWIDEQFTVVKVLTAQPCMADQCVTYQPGAEAKYVLEINAGMASKHGITEGMKMRLINIQ